MISELSFLIDLLINPRDPEQLKKDLAERIKYVEQNYSNVTAVTRSPQVATLFANGLQAPSTLAAMARHGDTMVVNDPPAVPVEQIAQTPITADAMARHAAIMGGAKPAVGRDGRPKRFL